MTVFQNPPPERLRRLLLEAHCIAVVGLSPNPARPSHRVAAAMQRRGYQIVPVYPDVDFVLGERAYPTLRDVPGPVDMVDVFRAPQHVDEVVEACVGLAVPALWLQDGVTNERAARRATGAGILTVMNRCILRDHDALVRG